MVLITNDGTLSHRILSPKKHIPKYYIVKLAESFQEDYVRQFAEGVIIDGGGEVSSGKSEAVSRLRKNGVYRTSRGEISSDKTYVFSC